MQTLTTIPHTPRLRRQAHRQPASLRPSRGVARAIPDGRHVGVDPLLTADDVAALLQVTKAWVYAETRAKRIPHVPLGRYVRYRRSAVLAWIAALERQSSRGVRVPLGEE
jgi:excisionase family DNA binding protein